MIKLSDINVLVYEDKKSNSYSPNTVVEACLELREVGTIDPRHRHDEKLIEWAKERAKLAILNKVYGDLRDPIEELYSIAMMKMPYCQELDLVREAKEKIDSIMRGEE